MIRVLVATILWLCLLPATAHAQPTLANLEAISPVPLGEWDFEGGQLHFPETVFGSLPAAGTSGRIYIVTDATTSSDCSAGGGTARALCRDTGATWESIGGGGGGGGNSFVTWDLPVGTDPVADSSTDTITFVCPPPLVCAGDSATDTLTLSVTTPTPTLSATPTPTVTTTAFACDPGFALDQAHPEACVELPTPDGGANFPTPTVVESVTPTPVVCATNAAWGLGGLFKAHPEECQAVGPTPTPTATATASPTATLTSAPTATATPFNYAAGDAPGGGATKVTGSATLPATCTEKDIYQDTDSGGTEFYVCTATDTWTKVITGSDVPANETDPTVPLLSLADLGDLCAANESTARNGTDTANICVAVAGVYPTPTVVVSATPTPVVCRTATIYGAQVGGLYKANPEECAATPAPTGTLGVTPTYTIPFATPTPQPSPTAPFLVGLQESAVTVGNCNILNLDGVSFDASGPSAGVCTITLATGVMFTTSTVQPSQLSRLAATDQLRYFGTSDQVGLKYDSTLDALTVVSKRLYLGPSPTPTTSPTSATSTPTATASPTPTATTTPVAATATPTGATVTPTPVPSPTPVLILGGQPINGCYTVGIGGQTLNPEYVGITSGGSTTQGNVSVLARVPTELRNIACGLSNDLGWGKSFSVEFEIAPLVSCIAASDNAASSCGWAAPAAGVRCEIKGTLRTNEIGCGEDLDLYPGSVYRAGPTYVPRGYVYHFAMRFGGLTGAWSCSWDVCPQGALK